jgi:hypothetical protein
MRGLRSARDQRGQTSAEYVGVLAFVAAVVALVLMSAGGIGATVVDKVQKAICSATGGDCGDGVAADGGDGGPGVGAADPGSGDSGGNGDGAGSEDPDDEEDPDLPDADPAVVEAATEDIRDELGSFWGPDYGDIADILEGLDPAEFNAVIANLDDVELMRILAGDLFIKGDDDHAIHPSDIDQQGLGDRYLLASLAETPQQNQELLHDVIRPNDNGTFTVTFYDDGDPVEIVVGPHIPATEGSPEFAGPGDEPVWSTSPEARASVPIPAT